jgi:hypothetical protein
MAQVTHANGNISKVEFNWGSGFLSQSDRVLQVPQGVKSISFYNQKGEITRKL